VIKSYLEDHIINIKDSLGVSVVIHPRFRKQVVKHVVLVYAVALLEYLCDKDPSESESETYCGLLNEEQLQVLVDMITCPKNAVAEAVPKLKKSKTTKCSTPSSLPPCSPVDKLSHTSEKKLSQPPQCDVTRVMTPADIKAVAAEFLRADSASMTPEVWRGMMRGAGSSSSSGSPITPDGVYLNSFSTPSHFRNNNEFGSAVSTDSCDGIFNEWQHECEKQHQGCTPDEKKQMECNIMKIRMQIAQDKVIVSVVCIICVNHLCVSA
jgi:hypothetical protein